MATFDKYEHFVEDVAHGQHDFSSDQVGYALSNVAPNLATDEAIGDVTEISYANLAETRNVATASSGQVGGVHTIALTDDSATASGGALPTFQYVTIYNVTSGRLIGVITYPSALTLNDGESLDIDFAVASITLT